MTVQREGLGAPGSRRRERDVLTHTDASHGLEENSTALTRKEGAGQACVWLTETKSVQLSSPLGDGDALAPGGGRPAGGVCLDLVHLPPALPLLGLSAGTSGQQTGRRRRRRLLAVFSPSDPPAQLCGLKAVRYRVTARRALATPSGIQQPQGHACAWFSSLLLRMDV